MTAHSIDKACAVALLALVLAGGTGERADATTSLTISGIGSGTVDGSAFSDDAITAVATFNWSRDVDGAGSGIGAYPLTGLSFDITGMGTYTSTDPSVLKVVVVQPALAGDYLVYLDTESGTSFGEHFTTETWDAATQTILLTGPVLTFFNPPFTVSLPASGSLVIDDFEGVDATASILVPEPVSLSLLGLGVAATGLLRRRRSIV